MNPNEPKNVVHQNGPEPVAERSTVPMWLVVILGLLIYWGSLFVAENAGGFDKVVYSPYHSADEVEAANPQDPFQIARAKGRGIFEKTCSACHQPNAMGKEGVAPPLAGSDWVLAPKGDRIVRIVLNGLAGPITVKGQDWNLTTMAAWRDAYDDEQIAAVLTYIRSQSEWSNNASPISPDLVRAARAEKHPAQMSPDELLKIPVQ